MVLVPDTKGIGAINRIIYEELCLGQIKEDFKQIYLDIMTQLRQAGAEAIILGCTEISLLLSQKDIDLPLYDTTRIHAKQAVYCAIN